MADYNVGSESWFMWMAEKTFAGIREAAASRRDAILKWLDDCASQNLPVKTISGHGHSFIFRDRPLPFGMVYTPCGGAEWRDGHSVECHFDEIILWKEQRSYWTPDQLLASAERVMAMTLSDCEKYHRDNYSCTWGGW